uniref:CCT domain-containing protein n=1 Tax=Phaeomonas parva TaxID=124430 RepID=A0A6U4E1H3_9STRA|mmetsp:Transcript_1915/g.5641  ORF Transcript_1915/g.5641 Transcript_1915/m.5641 type:complete len:240 (+) Transcript_1915:662-1381(+)
MLDFMDSDALGAMVDDVVPQADFEELLSQLLGHQQDHELSVLLSGKALPAAIGSAAKKPAEKLDDDIPTPTPAAPTDDAAWVSDEAGEAALDRLSDAMSEDFGSDFGSDADGDDDDDDMDVGPANYTDYPMFVPVVESAVAAVPVPVPVAPQAKPERKAAKAPTGPPRKLTAKEAEVERKRAYRATKITRWLQKRQRRKWGQAALYDSRVKAASKRPRVKGKFVKQEIEWVSATEVFKN